MATVLIGLMVTILAMAGLALGVLAGRSPLRGSCGGVGGMSCAGCAKRGRGCEKRGS